MTFVKDDLVTPDPNAFGVPPQTLGRVFRVAKVNPKNLRCDAEDGGRGINFPPELLLPFTGELPVAQSRPYVAAEYFEQGAIVTLKNGFPKHGITPTTPLIVVKDNGVKVNVVQLGGDDGRYIRTAKTLVERRTRQWLTEQLVEEA